MGNINKKLLLTLNQVYETAVLNMKCSYSFSHLGSRNILNLLHL